MLTVFITIIVIIISVFFMSIGIIFSNKELKASCGGDDSDCTCNAIQQRICKIKLNLTETR